jgi:hypothetical protein
MAYEIIVVNIKDPVPAGYFSVNIMRPSILGNPFFLVDEAKRDVVIGQYKEYLWAQMRNPDSIVFKTLLKYAQTANDIALLCCCKPKNCHGDVVKAAIEWIRDNKSLFHVIHKSKKG